MISRKISESHLKDFTLDGESAVEGNTRKFILFSLASRNFNQSLTAADLGITRNTLRKYVGNKAESKALAAKTGVS